MGRVANSPAPPDLCGEARNGKGRECTAQGHAPSGSLSDSAEILAIHSNLFLLRSLFFRTLSSTIRRKAGGYRP
ncbi:hypothetical protein [Azospirillum palustre]